MPSSRIQRLTTDSVQLCFQADNLQLSLCEEEETVQRDKKVTTEYLIEDIRQDRIQNGKDRVSTHKGDLWTLIQDQDSRMVTGNTEINGYGPGKKIRRSAVAMSVHVGKTVSFSMTQVTLSCVQFSFLGLGNVKMAFEFSGLCGGYVYYGSKALTLSRVLSCEAADYKIIHPGFYLEDYTHRETWKRYSVRQAKGPRGNNIWLFY